MFSSTISLTPSAASSTRELERLGHLAPHRRLGRGAVERHAAAGKPGRDRCGRAARSASVTVGAVAAAAVAGRARIGPGAVRPDGDPLQPVDPRDRAAAGADLDHLDDRDAQRQAAALFEAVDARDLEGAAGLRLQIVDQADLRGGAAHVVGQHLVEPALPGDLGGEDRAARRARFDEPHRKADRGLDRGQPAARQHQEQRAGEPLAPQQRLEVGEVAADHAAGHRRWRRRSRSARIRASPARPRSTSVIGTPGQMFGQDLAGAALMRRVGEAVQKADRDRSRCRSAARRSASAATPASSSGASTRPCASMRSRTGKRSRRGTSGGGRSMLTSYCSKRFSCRISIVSRKPSVVTSAVLAPLRSISALVASVVPWMMIDEVAGRERRLAQHLVDRREDGALGRLRRGQDLGAAPPLARFERHIGKGAADVDAQSRALCHPIAPRPDLGRECSVRSARAVNPRAASGADKRRRRRAMIDRPAPGERGSARRLAGQENVVCGSVCSTKFRFPSPGPRRAKASASMKPSSKFPMPSSRALRACGFPSITSARCGRTTARPT